MVTSVHRLLSLLRFHLGANVQLELCLGQLARTRKKEIHKEMGQVPARLLEILKSQVDFTPPFEGRT